MPSISLDAMLDAALSFTMGKKQEPVVAKPVEESTGDPMRDYVIELSETAKKLAAEDNPFDNLLNKAGLGGGSGDTSEDEGTSIIDQLKERIQQLQDEISEIQSSDLSAEEKQQQLALKQSELAQLQSQLQQLYDDQQGAGAQVGGSSFMNTGSLT
ncbi:FlxA-like family protein [Desulfovibrio ferrophilus]|uniref:Uncharacterized protein n=1 Tax=Desulfovibrio ferrophilus TaxID=241368 RepID=A0A2Z6B0R2_9BACT|nr:FlxA-like family protein [Desulfovibrio ferrophilus]BBD09091.1 uncharacterized protein DFE_2365 [Desulfovibrio ferrophilus]